MISIRQWLIIGACAALLLMLFAAFRRRRGRQWEDTAPPGERIEVIAPIGGTPPL